MNPNPGTTLSTARRHPAPSSMGPPGPGIPERMMARGDLTSCFTNHNFQSDSTGAVPRSAPRWALRAHSRAGDRRCPADSPITNLARAPAAIACLFPPPSDAFAGLRRCHFVAFSSRAREVQGRGGPFGGNQEGQRPRSLKAQASSRGRRVPKLRAAFLARLRRAGKQWSSPRVYVLRRVPRTRGHRPFPRGGPPPPSSGCGAAAPARHGPRRSGRVPADPEPDQVHGLRPATDRDYEAFGPAILPL